MPESSAQAFAAASAAMVRGVDAASTLHVLVADCLRLLAADSAGILVRMGDNDLELCVSTSHRATELESYQAQVESGPCFDSIKTGNTVSCVGTAEIEHRWPDFGPTMVESGFHSVHAIPMRWRGGVLGGLNLFWNTERQLSTDEHGTAQAFADICTLAIMQSTHTDDAARIGSQLQTVLLGRVIIEQAKGVLAQREGLTMADAFERLLDLNGANPEEPLTATATRVVEQTYSG